jgi:hypothetical protein
MSITECSSSSDQDICVELPSLFEGPYLVQAVRKVVGNCQRHRMVVTKHPPALEEGFLSKLMGLTERADVNESTNEYIGGLQGMPVV